MMITSPTLVLVDRSIRPAYRPWVLRLLNPELENTGPTEFDLSQITLWVHPKQKTEKGICASFIYSQLKDSGLLKTCLGLRDGEEIIKQKADFFQGMPNIDRVFLWKSVAFPRFDPTEHSLRVPFIGSEVNGSLTIRWEHIYHDLREDDPAAMISP